ncbi:MAG: DUF6356 family protein [Ascidiaceihabitans sp.]|jgi:hypothetical protein|nr:DUF6356 family protein [Ascidiaceihabitans sp.]
MFGRLFLGHLRSVDGNYFEHLLFAGGFAQRLLEAGVAALVHALVSCLFEKTASQMITQMHDKIHNR